MTQRQSTTPLRPAARLAVLFAIPLAIVGAALLLLPRALEGLTALLAAGETPVTLPVRFEVPRQNETSLIVSGGFTRARLVTSGLSVSARYTIGLGQLLGVAAIVALLVVGVGLAWSLWRGRELQSTMSTRLMMAGLVLVVLGSTSSTLLGVGRSAAAVELNPVAGGMFRTEFAFDPTLPCLGIAALLFALVFRHGEGLDADTDGLV